MFITAYKRVTLITLVPIVDSEGTLFVLDTGDTVHVRIGRTGEVPLLEFDSDNPTDNGSSVTATNPATLTIHQDDLDFNPGVYDLEVWICDASQNVVHQGGRGVFALHDTQVGEMCESSSSEPSTSSSSSSSQSSSSSSST